MAVNDDILTTIAGYAAALAADSVSPQPSYTLDNKSVSRTEWRESLVRMIKELQAIVNGRDPYVVSTRHVL